MAELAIIAGHGAGDPGACANGYSEAERVRALAARIGALGGSRVTVLDTSRNWYADGGVSSLSLPASTQLLELHMDSASPSARGGHVIVNGRYPADSYDEALASFIGAFMPGRAQALVGRTDLANSNRAAARGYSYRLLECGFITNAGDLGRFNSETDALARGILGAFGIASGGRGWVERGGRWWYERGDGTYPADGWESIGGEWYLFDADGWMLTGWQERGGLWYYLGESGAMATGWRHVGGEWYYLNPAGDMATGWKEDGGRWYLLSDSGAMLEGFRDVGGSRYFLGESGEMATGWFFEGSDWYFAGEDGAIRSGVVEDGGELYSLRPERDSRFGALEVGWVEREGRRMHARRGGALARSVCAEVDGKWYAFRADCSLVDPVRSEEGGAIDLG